MQTYRRLDDRVRLYGLTVPGMLGIFVGVLLTYFGVKFSPLPFKPTVTISAVIFGFVAAIFVALQGQAMNPGQYVVAIVRWRLGRRFYTVTSGELAVGGVVVDAVPSVLADGPLVDEPPEWEDALGAGVLSGGASS